MAQTDLVKALSVELAAHAELLQSHEWVNERAQWKHGPWDDEPDFAVVEHAGYVGFVKRTWTGALCGYIAVPLGHPWHGQDMHAVEAECHGGFTFTEGMGPNQEFWCLGFDCGHAFDVQPLFANMFKLHEVGQAQGFEWVYRDFEYVTNQVKGLCQQAHDAQQVLAAKTLTIDDSSDESK